MLGLIVEFACLAALIFAAGACLSWTADQIAEITGFGRLLVGSVLLAGATSLPELTVDMTAVRIGQTDLAAGDLLGSSLMNLLILAVLDLSHHSRGKMLSREAAGHALSGMLSIALTALVGVAILTSSKIPTFDLLGMSAPTWGILVAYVLGVRVVYLDQRISAQAVPPVDGATPSHPPLWKPVAIFAAAAVVLMIVGPRLAHTASRLADVSGLGGTFVGTSLVAFSTSLPELVSSIAALRMKAYDLAIGNVLGSNAFNMVLFVPLDVLHPGSIFAAVSHSHLVTCLAVVAATSLVVMGQLYRVEARRKFLDPDAWLVVSVVAGALWLIYRMA